MTQRARLGVIPACAIIAAMTDLAAPSRNSDLVRRIGITLAALAVFRAGFWIPLPGVDVNAFAVQMSGNPAALALVSVMALGVMPLLSALILAEAAMIVWPRLRAWASTTAGEASLRHGVVVAALLLAGLQANGIAAALEAVAGVVSQPGLAFRAGVIGSLVGSTAIVVWLASWITRAGIGHRFWVLLAATHLDALADGLRGYLALLAQGGVDAPSGLIGLAFLLATLVIPVAAFAVLTRSAPPLAGPLELAWAAVLGFAAATWMAGGLVLLGLLALPDVPDLSTSILRNAPTPLLILSLALVFILRRRSLAAGSAPFNVAAAVPAAVVLGALVGIGSLLPSVVPGGAYLPSPAATIVLAAVGLAILERVRGLRDDATDIPTS